MPVGSTIMTTGYMYPEIFAVRRLHYKLVKVTMTFNPIKPLASGLHIRMSTVIVPDNYGSRFMINGSRFLYIDTLNPIFKLNMR